MNWGFRMKKKHEDYCLDFNVDKELPECICDEGENDKKKVS